MPTVCYFKPIRSQPRYFSGRDAARVFCSAVEHGASPRTIIDEIHKKCASDPCEREKVRAHARAILEAEAVIRVALAITIGVSAALLVALGAVLYVIRRIPGMRLLLRRLDGSILRMEDALLKAKDITGHARVIEETTLPTGDVPPVPPP